MLSVFIAQHNTTMIPRTDDDQSTTAPSHSQHTPQHHIPCDEQQAASCSNSVKPALVLATDCLDGDDLLEAHEALAYVRAGLSPAAIESLRQRKKYNEEIAVCKMLLQVWHAQHGMELHHNSSVLTEDVNERRRIVLCYAGALEGLRRRQEAVDALRLCLNIGKEEFNEEAEEGGDDDLPDGPLDIQVTLALAKLYFKDNQKEKAMRWLQSLLTQLRGTAANSIPAEEVSDVFHLAGWVKIHNDDHTVAYELWTEGYGAVPGCASLERQFQKRACWDRPLTEDAALAQEIVGGDGTVVEVIRRDDLEGFPVRDGTPALALFHPATQQRNLVFRSRRPILTAIECANVLQKVEEFHQEHREGAWGTVRHSSVKTTDVAVEDIPALRPWLRELLRQRLYPLIHCAYPQLADGSSTLDGNHSRVQVHDAFIVRYDADTDGSFSLPEHSDTSAVSFTVALNSHSQGDFEGGGTWFEALGEDQNGSVVDAERGHAVVFAGPLRHAGYPVEKGVRVILVLFLYIENFSYGGLLENYTKKYDIGVSCGVDQCQQEEGEEKQDSKCSDDKRSNQDSTGRKASGDMPGGFVVYNQTVELVEMLNRRAESVLD